ncbi:BlaI/MecI/CopY family transcriptional regulator [Streptomyces sp. NPDC055078]
MKRRGHSQTRELGDLENAVMTRLWQRTRPAAVRDVQEALRPERPLAYTTVLTVLDHLHDKRWVRRWKQGRAFYYTAVCTRADYVATLMSEALAKSDDVRASLLALADMMVPEQRAAFDDVIQIVNGPRRHTPSSYARRTA